MILISYLINNESVCRLTNMDGVALILSEIYADAILGYKVSSVSISYFRDKRDVGYAIMYNGMYYTKKDPCWGVGFTTEKGDAKTWSSFDEAQEALSSCMGSFAQYATIETITL